MIQELEILTPDEQKTGIYSAGNPFSFYSDLAQILRTAMSRVLIVDAYLGREVFDLYLEAIPPIASIEVLTSIKPPATSLPVGITSVAKVFKASRTKFELHTSISLHDRVVIVDDRCWVVGQSIKDAAYKKPTYMVEIKSPEMVKLYINIWLDSTIVAL